MRKQLTKQLTTALLAMALLMTTVLGGLGGLSVNADPIVPSDAPTEGSLKITKNGAVTQNGTQTLEPLGGAVFTIYKIFDLTPGNDPGDYATFTPVAHYNSVVGTLTPDELQNYSATEIEGLATALLPLTVTAGNGGIAMDPTDPDDGISTKGSLGLGYYLVVETTTPAGYLTAKPFFVAIPSSNNYANDAIAATTWVYDVEVAPKNEKVTIDKTIANAQGDHENGTANPGDKSKDADNDTVAVGDFVDYRLDTIAPSYGPEYFLDPANLPKFVITDIMSDGLSITDDTDALRKPIVVKADGVALVLGVDYTIVAKDETGNNPDLVITFTRAFLEDEDNHGVAIEVTYSALLTEAAVMGTTGNSNKVNLTFTNKPGTDTNGDPYEEDTPDEETKVYVYDLEVMKTDTGREGELEGAEFELYRADENGNFVDAATHQVGTAAKITDSDGLLIFKGVDAGIYYLKETKSPAGYTLLTNPIKVEIEAQLTDGEPNGNIKFYVEGVEVTVTTPLDNGQYQSHLLNTTGKVSVTVENKKGFTLPSTGGMGITIFLAVAFVGITGISVILMKKKKA